MINRKLRSGENFQGASKQKDLKQKGVKQGLNLFREKNSKSFTSFTTNHTPPCLELNQQLRGQRLEQRSRHFGTVSDSGGHAPE